MARIDQYSRLRHHRLTTSGQTFTIPTSEDHTDGTWLNTDLYLGEFGINMTDDKVFFRSNNGIIQIATGTSSSGFTSSQSNVFMWSAPNIIIGSTYSADSVSPRSGYYTDLGTTTLRWKDLYLGGSIAGSTKIDVNGGLELTSSTGGVLTTDGVVGSNAPIEINSFSSNSNKDRPLFLNTRFGLANGSTNYITIASSNTVTTDNNSYVFVAGTNTLTISNSLSYVTFLGRANGRPAYKSNTVYVGGNLAVRGDFVDDGTGQYFQSEWITSQNSLQTSDAMWYDIAQIPWSDIVMGGDIIQVKANIISSIINDASNVYGAEITGVFSLDSGPSNYQVGTPILNEWSNWGNAAPGLQPQVKMESDANGVYIKCKGVLTYNIQWLCTYSHHRLINVY